MDTSIHSFSISVGELEYGPSIFQSRVHELSKPQTQSITTTKEIPTHLSRKSRHPSGDDCYHCHLRAIRKPRYYATSGRRYRQIYKPVDTWMLRRNWCNIQLHRPQKNVNLSHGTIQTKYPERNTRYSSHGKVPVRHSIKCRSAVDLVLKAVNKGRYSHTLITWSEHTGTRILCPIPVHHVPLQFVWQMLEP